MVTERNVHVIDLDNTKVKGVTEKEEVGGGQEIKGRHVNTLTFQSGEPRDAVKCWVNNKYYGFLYLLKYKIKI